MTQYLFTNTAGKPEYGAEEIVCNAIVVTPEFKERVDKLLKIVRENGLDHAAVDWCPEIYHLPYSFTEEQLILDQKSINSLEQHDPVLLEMKEELIQEKLKEGDEEVNDALNMRGHMLVVHKRCWTITFYPKHADYFLETIKKKGIPFSNHQSDLYIPVTDETRELISQYEFKQNVSTFKNRVEGGHWYDIPFAYEPYWEARVRSTDKGPKREDVPA